MKNRFIVYGFFYIELCLSFCFIGVFFIVLQFFFCSLLLGPPFDSSAVRMSKSYQITRMSFHNLIALVVFKVLTFIATYSECNALTETV